VRWSSFWNQRLSSGIITVGREVKVEKDSEDVPQSERFVRKGKK
jgi:hypothetical protein